MKTLKLMFERLAEKIEKMEAPPSEAAPSGSEERVSIVSSPSSESAAALDAETETIHKILSFPPVESLLTTKEERHAAESERQTEERLAAERQAIEDREQERLIAIRLQEEFQEQQRLAAEKLAHERETEEKASEVPDWAAAMAQKKISPANDGKKRIGIEAPELVRHVMEFLRGGNIWAAGGVVMLLLGFAYLLSYMAERDILTIEMRISMAALVGLVMVGVGVKIRALRPTFAVITQGGGIGVLYLSIFGAAKMTTLIGAPAALVLMTVLIVSAVALAILQNAQLLALFGFLGGYAAPILLSDGSGNYVALFSYYSLLGLGLLGLSWFKNWAWLFTIAAAATFMVMGGWVFESYDSYLHFNSVQPFLIGFGLIFTSIALFSQSRGRLSFSHAPDAILTLGTPFALIGLQIALAKDFPHGLAWSAGIMGKCVSDPFGAGLALSGAEFERRKKTGRTFPGVRLFIAEHDPAFGKLQPDDRILVGSGRRIDLPFCGNDPIGALENSGSGSAAFRIVLLVRFQRFAGRQSFAFGYGDHGHGGDRFGDHAKRPGKQPFFRASWRARKGVALS